MLSSTLLKSTSLLRTTSFDIFRVKICSGVYAVTLLNYPKKTNVKIIVPSKGTAKSRIRGAEIPKPIATKYCMSGAVDDIIKHANFGEDPLRCFGAARGRILGFCID